MGGYWDSFCRNVRYVCIEWSFQEYLHDSNCDYRTSLLDGLGVGIHKQDTFSLIFGAWLGLHEREYVDLTGQPAEMKLFFCFCCNPRHLIWRSMPIPCLPQRCPRMSSISLAKTILPIMVLPAPNPTLALRGIYLRCSHRWKVFPKAHQWQNSWRPQTYRAHTEVAVFTNINMIPSMCTTRFVPILELE